MLPFFIFEFKQRKSILNQPKKGDATHKNQTSVRRWNGRKISNDFIHDRIIFYKNSKIIESL